MFNDEVIDEYADMVGAFVAGGLSISSVRSKFLLLRVPEPLAEAAIARHELRMFDIAGVEVLRGEGDHNNWYQGPTASDRFWPPVQERLLQSLPASAVESIDHITSLTLAQLTAPGTTRFADRGLVVGYVQSGKTTNFMALAAKAADRGFKLIVILSGVTDILRNQTQDRVDTTLVGDSVDWYPLTRANDDFRETGDGAPLFVRFNGALVAVIKKNPARLRRLRNWIRSAGDVAQQLAPLLLIDDEADQASIDVGAERTSVINQLLRDILDHPRSAYVAYTATPFANLLIDPNNENDLYPRDFVVSMPKPAGYFGAAELFGDPADPEDTGLDLVRTIPAAEAIFAHPPAGTGAVFTWQPAAGSELRRAVMWFLLSTAAKRARLGGVRHSTMLVHTSMLSAAHYKTREVVLELLAGLRIGLATEDQSLLAELQAFYETEVQRVSAAEFDHSAVPWEDVSRGLRASAEDVDVVVDNYRSTDRLSYSRLSPTTAIVIGGNTLSRGLTLEGLTSSYFVRSASAYDTLLQMGRWFGYRPGYEDLCRIWLTPELTKWFRDLSGVELELRAEIARYGREGLTPLEMGVRIRLHPDLAVTAQAKMRHAVPANVSFSGRATGSVIFNTTDIDWLTRNLEAARTVLEAAAKHGATRTNFAGGKSLSATYPGFTDVSPEDVLRFIDEFQFHPAQASLSADLLKKYISNEMLADNLLRWRIIVMAGGSGATFELPHVGQFKMAKRTRLIDSDPANIRALMSADDRIPGIDWAPGETPPTGDALLTLRGERLPGEAILRLYVIDPASSPTPAQAGARAALDAAAPVVAAAFDFPYAKSPDSKVSYVVAKVPGIADVEELDEISSADQADEAELD
ncbi:Z1 domain-containing protein [Microbacterium sp. P5_E9]